MSHLIDKTRVRRLFPRAIAVRHSDTRFIVWDKSTAAGPPPAVRLGTGRTEAEAWRSAAEAIDTERVAG